MKSLTIILLLSLSVYSTSDPCETQTCQKSKNLCSKPSCGYDNYATNPDMFFYHFKKNIKSLSIRKSEYREEILEVEKEGSNNFTFFEEKLKYVKKFQRELEIEEHSSTEEISINDLNSSFYKLKKSQSKYYSEITSSEETIEISKLYGSNNKKQNLLDELDDDLGDDVDNLGSFLKQNRNDKMRTGLLYPQRCNSQCRYNYLCIYSIWSRLMRKFIRIYKRRFKKLSCWKKRRRMRRFFNRLCRRYNPRIYLMLQNYYNYMIGNNVCRKNWW